MIHTNKAWAASQLVVWLCLCRALSGCAQWPVCDDDRCSSEKILPYHEQREHREPRIPTERAGALLDSPGLPLLLASCFLKKAYVPTGSVTLNWVFFYLWVKASMAMIYTWRHTVSNLKDDCEIQFLFPTMELAIN